MLYVLNLVLEGVIMARKYKNEFILNEYILLNTVLFKHKDKLKTFLLKKGLSINNSYYEIINPYVEFEANGNVLRIGLLVRINQSDIVIFFKDETDINENALFNTLINYLKDKSIDNNEVNLYKLKLKNADIINLLNSKE